MIDVRHVQLDSKPGPDQFFEPINTIPVGRAMSSEEANDRIVWLLTHPGTWLRWSTSSHFPVSARPLNNERFEKWRGASSNEDERGLWIRFKEGK